MSFEFENQLTDEDKEIISATRRAIHGGRTSELEYFYEEITGSDPHTDLPISTTVSGVISGVVQTIEEDDRLLNMGGKIRVGDTKAILLYEDAVTYIGLDKLRLPSTRLVHNPGQGFDGQEYQIDVMTVEGIGQISRVELGLVRS